MTKLSRIRVALAASLMAALSLTTVGAAAVTADAGVPIAKKTGGDAWCC